MYRTNENPPIYRWKIFDGFKNKINAGVTGREPMEDFNQALHTGDNDISVINNRKKLCASQGIPFELYTCAQQTHGVNIKVVGRESAGLGRDSYKNSIHDADALIVTEGDIMINIHIADCVPITLYDHKANIGALVHSGWKGTAKEICIKTIDYMIKELSCSQDTIIAGIGPSIDPCCFQIGADTAKELESRFPYSSNVIKRQNGHIYGDLKQANREQLLRCGIKDEYIELSTICTSCSNKSFYSYRADSGKTGRFGAFLTLL